MQNAALRAASLPHVYLAFPVPPEKLPEALRGAYALGVLGLNLTIPHKTAALELVDDLDAEARSLGAVNTLRFVDGRVEGYNTDAVGFIRSLRYEGIQVPGMRAVVYGAGGAARAVVSALVREGGHVTVINRTRERALALMEVIGTATGKRHALAVAQPGTDEECKALQRADLLVNATSLGMAPHPDTTPLLRPEWLPSRTVVVDLVYRPRETLLLRTAREAGCRTVNGVGMLVHQGAESFRLWFGMEPDVRIMTNAVERVLAQEESQVKVSKDAVAAQGEV